MNILVATDFSPEAAEAARVASELGQALGASLRFVHVLEPQSLYPLDNGETTTTLDEEATAQAVRRLSAQAEQLGADPRMTSVRVGDPVKLITDEVVSQGADLAVVGGCGARGQSSFRNHAENLALTLPCPVLVVRPVADRIRFALANKRRLRVFVAADRSEASDRAIAWVSALRRKLPCDVVVGHYYDPNVEHQRLGIPEGDAPFTGHPRVVEALTRELRQRLGPLDSDATVHCEPRIGLTAVDLLSSARVANADMIVVGAHRRSKVKRFFYGSVARDILRHSDVPVVCVGTTVTQASHTAAVQQ